MICGRARCLSDRADWIDEERPGRPRQFFDARRRCGPLSHDTTREGRRRRDGEKQPANASRRSAEAPRPWPTEVWKPETPRRMFRRPAASAMSGADDDLQHCKTSQLPMPGAIDAAQCTSAIDSAAVSSREQEIVVAAPGRKRETR